MVEPTTTIIAGTVYLGAKASAGLAAFSAFAGNFVSNAFNKITGHSTQIELEEKRQEMQVKQMQCNYLQHKDNQEFQLQLSKLNADQQREVQEYIQNCNHRLQQDSHAFQRWKLEQEQSLQIALAEYTRDTQSIVEEKRQEMQVRQMQFQYLQQKESQEFQLQLSQLNADRQRELQEYIQECNRRLQQDSHTFQQWKLQQEQSLQIALAAYARETQLMLAAYQRETTMKMPEVSKIFEAWPLTLYPSQILEHSRRSPRPPIRVIIAPPKVNFDRNDPRIQELNDFHPENSLNNKLLEFLGQHYHVKNPHRPIDFISSVWDTKRSRGKAAIKALHSMLSSESVLVLESEIDRANLSLQWGFWMEDDPDPTYEILFQVPYWKTIEDSIKERCRKIRKMKESLQQRSIGKDVKINPLIFSKIDDMNLAILEQEEQLIELEQDLSLCSLPYQATPKDFDTLTDWLAIEHCWRIALYVDLYYLVVDSVPPLLPHLLPELFPQGVPLNLVKYLLKIYNDTLENLTTERSHLVPDFYLDLALGFAHLPDRGYSIGQVIKSLQSFLHLCAPDSGLMTTDLSSCLTAIEQYLNPSHRPYLAKLNTCLTTLNLAPSIDLKTVCFERGMKSCERGNYATGIDDFSQAIELDSFDPRFYYRRGMAHDRLSHYPQAIADYTRSLELNSHQPQAYSGRGSIYYQQQDFTTALADYQRALELDPHLESALRGRDLTYQAIAEELKRKQAQPQQGDVLTIDLGSGVKLDLLYIPAGSFLMGSPDSDDQAYDSEKPQHRVNVLSFHIGKYPITQEQYRAVMGSNPSIFTGDRRPVEQVSWFDAVAFCQKLSQLTGDNYRLPSEAEWEYAARGGTTTRYHYGDTLTTDLANFDRKYSGTTDVGKFMPNAFGLYDVHGNVLEWCQDTWHSNYQGAPTDGSAWVSDNENDNHLLRGGSWNLNSWYCRSACRYRSAPDYRSDDLGVRVVLDPRLL